MSARTPENLLIDYLYDELSPTEREAFEQELATNAALKLQVEQMRETRSLMKRVPEVEAPVALKYELIREARHRVSAPAPHGFWERLNRWILNPAMATAAVVALVAVVGLFNLPMEESQKESSASKSKYSSPAADSAPRILDKAAAPSAPLPMLGGGAEEPRMAAAVEEEAEEEAPTDMETEGRSARLGQPGSEKVAKEPVKAVASGVDNRVEAATASPEPSKPAAKPVSQPAGKIAGEPSRSKSVMVAKATPALNKGRRSAKRSARAKPSMLHRQLNVGSGAYGGQEVVGKSSSATGNVKRKEIAQVLKVANKSTGTEPAAEAQDDAADSPSSAPLKDTAPAAQAQKQVSEAQRPVPVVQQNAGSRGVAKSQVRSQWGTAKKGRMESKQDTSQRQNQRFTVAARQFNKTAKSKRMPAVPSGNPDAVRRNAAASYRGKKLTTALSQYRSLLKKHPRYRHRSAVLVETARVELAVGDLRSARRHLLEVVRGKNKSYAKRAKAMLAVVEKRMRARAAAKKKRSQTGKTAKSKSSKVKTKAVKPAPAQERSAPAKAK